MAQDFSKMWETVEIPVYVLISWSIISVILTGLSLLNSTILSVAGIVIVIGAFGYIGYTAKGKGETIGSAAKSGVFAGVIYGAAGAVLSIISFYCFPHMYTEGINQAVAQGVPRETIEMVMKIVVYAGIVWMPIFYALIGAGLSALGGLLNKN